MIKASQLTKDMKYMAGSMNTRYSNIFPYNCGWIGSGYKSYDCINLLKSYINDPDSFLAITPVGDYVTPGKVIPDWTELDILNACSDVTNDFTVLVPGEYMYMYGHAGVYVGEFTDYSGVVNVVECTTDWGCNGVITTYVDEYGHRFNHKGGMEMRGWEKHGKLDRYIEYDAEMSSNDHALILLNAACDVINGVYENYPYRESLLSTKFGKKDGRRIQELVNLAYKED